MIKMQFNEACEGILAYNTSEKLHAIVIKGPGKKRIDNIFFSYTPINGADDPATIRTARLIIAEGTIANGFIDPALPTYHANNKPTLGQLTKIVANLGTAGGSHRVMSLTNVGIWTSENDLSIIVTPAYVSGDSAGQMSQTMVTLSVSGVVGPDVFNGSPGNEPQLVLA